MASPAEILVRDPLNDVSRKERKALLAASAVSFTIVETGLVPTKISALGVDFSPADQKSLLFVLALIIIYFLISFCIYAISDFISWRIAYRNAVKELVESRYDDSDPHTFSKQIKIKEDMKPYMMGIFSFGNLSSMSRRVSLMRVMLDFFIPLLFGITTIGLLLFSEVSKKGS